MKSLLVFLLLSLSFASAQLRVVATYPWIGELVKEVGGDRVRVHVIARPDEDFHFVVPRPSHIAKLRDADLLVINGASLEVGFLPPLLQQSNNPRIQPGREGFLDLSEFVQIIEKPERVSREMGDVHPEGNPHYVYDPYNIPVLAKAVTERMCQLRQSECSFYRSNLEDFLRRWNAKLKEWDEGFLKLRGLKVIQWHKTYNYLFNRYGIQTIGTLEPIPGIPPTARHLEQLVSSAKGQGVRYVVIEGFRAGERRTAQRVAEQIGAKVAILPSDVGSEGAKSLFEMYDIILRRLSQ
ncbi:MAG: metal ABC transporter solute-binding protein, Zn/Mn family [Aquificaceae bacterium]|jgi:zinc/manganese transport system substrate-binding protein|uniref:metal ABC transporter solute-binding protein, Zn/Mn family n=1 Tax=Hydrogenobacter sp. Uz 6-8 TaxID=3384828 RepID=UPI0030AA0D81